MSAVPYPLALLTMAAVVHAVWNALLKRAGAGDALFLWSATALGAPVVLGALIWWALIHRGLGPHWWAALVSTLLHTSYAIALQRAYRAADMSTVYPTSRGVAPLLVTSIVVITGGAQPSTGVWVGLPIIACGVALTAGVRSSEQPRGVGIRHGLLVAACTAGYTLWDSYSAQQLAVEVVPYLALSGAAQVVLLTIALWGRRGRMKAFLAGSWRAALPVTVLTPLGYGLVYLALQHAPAETVAAIRNLTIVFGVLAGVVLLDERPDRRTWVGIAVITAGAVASSR